MKNYTEIKQGSIEWFEIKWGKIGGTLSQGLFVDSNTLLLDILSQKIEEFEPSEGFINAHMQRGKELEPFALEYISKYTGIDFKNTGWLELENSILGISPDGISECEKFACEIKCLSRKEHTAILLNNEIPREKMFQLIHYFTVNEKLESLWFIAFRPESIKPFVFEVTKDTIFDIGLKIKQEVEVIGAKGIAIKPRIETNPDLRTVSEWSKLAIQKSKELEVKMNDIINKLNF